MANHSIDVELIVESLGGDVKAAEFFEITRQGVAKWRKEKRIPNARLLHLKAARPDLFVEPRSGTERREDDRRQHPDPDFGDFGEPRDGDRRQDDRRRDCGESEAAA